MTAATSNQSSTDELRDSLAQVQELVAGMTPGALTVYDANEGDGWPPRPLWCFKNDAYDSGDEPALQGSIHYGGKEDADAIVAAIAWLRDHGPELMKMLDRHGAGDADRSAELTTAWIAGAESVRDRDGEDSARLDWLCSGRQKKVERTLSDGWCRVYQDMASIMDPEDWHAMTDQFYPTTREAIDAAMAGERGGKS